MKFLFNVVCLLDVSFCFLIYNFYVELFFLQRRWRSLHDCGFFFIDMTDDQNSNERDDSDDDYDFYDFVEIAAEKFDSITQQSRRKIAARCSNRYEDFFFVVEERKEESLQRWQRKKG